MKNVLRSLIVTAAALAAAGCISTSEFEAAQQRISELQEELANIKRTASSKEEVQNVNVRIAEQTEALLKSNATLVAKVAEIDETIQRTQGSFEQSSYRLDQLSQQMAALRRDVEEFRGKLAAIESAQAATAAPSGGEVTSTATSAPPANPTDLYQASIRDYQRGNFDLAIEGFREFVDTFGTSDLADNAAYWIGESLFSQKKYREAIAQFDAVVTRYPRSDKVPGALLKKGYAYIAINERAQGIVQLQYVLHEHPRSEEAALARTRLRQLGISTE